MDAFESLVTMLLEREGFWVRSSFKVELTKEEKRQIGRHSSPRWELDLVAYKGATNELRIVECKSYLDSRGVSIAAFDGKNPDFAARFKLFNEPKLQQVVFDRLVAQLVKRGSIAPDPKLSLCLVAGKIVTNTDRKKLKAHFAARGWLLWDDVWLSEALHSVAAGGYENEIAAVVAKLLLRGENGLTVRRSGRA